MVGHGKKKCVGSPAIGRGHLKRLFQLSRSLCPDLRRARRAGPNRPTRYKTTVKRPTLWRLADLYLRAMAVAAASPNPGVLGDLSDPFAGLEPLTPLLPGAVRTVILRIDKTAQSAGRTTLIGSIQPTRLPVPPAKRIRPSTLTATTTAGTPSL